MKTTLIKSVVFVSFLLIAQLLSAQYEGGIADGSSRDTNNTVTCATPNQFYAYFGGDGDGFGQNGLMTTTCAAPDQFFAYFGGNGDGSTTDNIDATSCGTPAQFFAYFGGNGDGFSKQDVNTLVCDTPDQFYAYFGGDGDGSVQNGTNFCPVDPPVADFIATPTTICEGETVQFTDTSTNSPFVWAWTFTGGTPDESDVQNPLVQYDTAGTYEVSLTATNNNGSDTKTVAMFITVNEVPEVLTTTPAERCDEGTVTLMATASVGTLNWYDVENGGIILGSGESFTTPSISETTTFYVEVENSGCNSERVAVIATVNDTPTITDTTPGSRCDAGQVMLSASASSGTINWYDIATGGVSLFTGANFTTPIISETTTYYVQTSENGCDSPRTAVIATINDTPEITSTTPASRCDEGSVTLMATADAGTIRWYANATGGSVLATGGSFTTPSISVTTTYYAEAAIMECASERAAVVATINDTPTITSTTPASRCDTGTVILMATADAGTLQWYDVASGGTVLGTGNSFETPSISMTTTYYVESDNMSCVSERTAVIATINDTPSITSTTPAERCGNGSVTLMATSDFGSIQWFANETGGAVLATGGSFTTPNLSSTTTYYVGVTDEGCPSSRTAVIATINDSPEITSTTPASRCDAGSVTLMATSDIGMIRWYDMSSGGTILSTGNSYTTPNLTMTTTYYAEAFTDDCISERVAVLATVNDTPSVTSSTPAERCGAGTVTLVATSDTGTIRWYEMLTGGTILATGNSFTTPTLTETTTYYAEAFTADCISERVAVIATVDRGDAPTGETEQTFCDGEIVGSIQVNGTSIVWYDAAENGNVVPDNALITDGTTYYASQTVDGCESIERIAVTMTGGECLDIKTEDPFVGISLYPNPVDSILNISSSQEITKITIYDMVGKVILQKVIRSIDSVIDTSTFASGQYIVKVDIQNASQNFKIIKQ